MSSIISHNIHYAIKRWMNRKPGVVLAAAVIWGLATPPAAAETSGPFPSSAGPLSVERVAGPLDHPWGFTFIGGSDAVLVTERSGALRVVRNGHVSAPVAGVPDVADFGQGGLLDVALDPDFATTNRIFLSYAEPVGATEARTAVASGVLTLSVDGGRLDDVRVIFRQIPALSGSRHFGSRLVFADDKTLFITTGDRGNRPLAQLLNNHVGKIIRINRDGSIPGDNPFLDRTDVLDEIWSYGHRNPQGAAKRPSDGAYFSISHGARGGDEVNRPQAGKNYGWPIISYGTHYSGRSFPGQTLDGMEQPLFYWDPSIAPSGAAFYEGDLFPAWLGSLFVGALKDRLISRLHVQDDVVREEEQLFQREFGRVRDVRFGPQGALWFAVDDSEGYLYRVTPAN